MNKITFKAFTLLEVLFGMIISSLVITTACLGYEMTVRRLSDFKQFDKVIGEAMDLRAVFGNDIFNAETITLADGIVCTGSKRVIYQIGGPFIIRRDGVHIDTFRLSVSNLHSSFEGKLQVEHGSLIDRISFSAEIFNEKEDFLFKKEYEASTLINSQETQHQK